MIMILSEEPPEPYAEPRGTCPECGSARVTHHLLGGPDPRTEESDPPWLQWHGCLPAFGDRSCEDCEAIWDVEDRGENEEHPERSV
ncbi:hypothetical protein ACT3SP_08885 [Brachybacterium sp. AOP43-C2-M15]|uniref:hypothetical protein n=1 Tax=Brachybacterium sp. AOP43-C2-M15 TaxID=3457661 RepID=UPI0040338E36